MHGMLLGGACEKGMRWPWYRCHEQCKHSFKDWVYKPSKMTIKRWHCSGNGKNKLKQQSAVDNQNTQDYLKIFLRGLLLLYNQSIPNSPTWPSLVCLASDWQIPNTYWRGTSNSSEISYLSWKSSVWSTSLLWVTVSLSPLVSVTWFSSTYLPGCDHTKNSPKIG